MPTTRGAPLDQFVALGNADVQREYRELCDELNRLKRGEEKVRHIEKVARDLGFLAPSSSHVAPIKKAKKSAKSGRFKKRNAPAQKTPTPTSKPASKKEKKTAAAPNDERIAIQLDLLRAKATAGNGKIPPTDLARIAKRHGIKLGSATSLLATTQGAYRSGFLRRLIHGLSNGEATRKLLEVAPLYGKNMMPVLQKEAGF